MSINQAIEPISDAEKAKRYRRKLEDLFKVADDFLWTFTCPLPKEQNSAAVALADELTLIYRQMQIEDKLDERTG